MKPYYRNATVADAINVAKNIRKEDKLEMEGLGQSPNSLFFHVLLSEITVSFFNKHNKICGVAGIQRDPKYPNVGKIWMICTPELEHNPVTFVKQAKKWISEQTDFTMLHNIADARNIYHHKLLKLLGFVSLNKVYIGSNQLEYIEIVKLCVH